MTQFFEWVLNLFLSTPTEIIVLVLGGLGVSILSQVFKRVFKVEKERWAFLLVTGFAFAGSFLDWFLSAQNLPPAIIGIQTPLLLGIAQGAYFWVVKPFNHVITGYKANKVAIQEKLAEVEVAPVPTDINTLEDAQKVVDAVEKPAIPLAIPNDEVATIEAESATEAEEPESVRPVATF